MVARPHERRRRQVLNHRHQAGSCAALDPAAEVEALRRVDKADGAWCADDRMVVGLIDDAGEPLVLDLAAEVIAKPAPDLARRPGVEQRQGTVGGGDLAAEDEDLYLLRGIGIAVK